MLILFTLTGYGIGVRLDPSDAKFVDIIHSDADSIVEVVKGEGGLSPEVVFQTLYKMFDTECSVS